MTDNLDQMPFGGAEFAENPEPRCPCLLLLDTSGSMNGSPIQELNNGLATFKDAIASDSMALKRVELGIVSFGPVQVQCEFQTVDTFIPPTLAASGDTPMGAAIEKGLSMLEDRKQSYKANGISYYRPWIFLITDGGPTDGWKGAAERVHKGEGEKRFSFFGVGVEGANFEVLKQIAVREPLKLKGLRFQDLFIWLSNSLGAVSRSTTGDQVPLANPATPEGWASV
jgi:uncharacterized protein YegL